MFDEELGVALDQCKATLYSLGCFAHKRDRDGFLRILARLSISSEEAIAYWGAIDLGVMPKKFPECICCFNRLDACKTPTDVATMYGVLLKSDQFPRALLVHLLVAHFFPRRFSVCLKGQREVMLPPGRRVFRPELKVCARPYERLSTGREPVSLVRLLTQGSVCVS